MKRKEDKDFQVILTGVLGTILVGTIIIAAIYQLVINLK